MQVSIFPNPSEGNVTVAALGVEETTLTEIRVFNLLGQQVYGWKGQTEGAFSHTLDMTGIGAGQYIVEMKMGQITINEKLVMIR